VLVVLALDHRPLLHDRLVAGVRVSRVQLLHPVHRELLRELGALDLILHVAAQVPRHRLEPGDRVGRAPGLRGVAGVGDAQQPVFQAQLEAAASLQVGVDAVRVGVQVATGLGGQQGEFGFGGTTPAERPDEGVCLDAVRSEQLRKPPGCHMPAEVHLPEAVLSVQVTLCLEQVGGVVRVDLRNAPPVPDHLHFARQSGHRDSAVDLRK
jgi:hypothetical protein